MSEGMDEFHMALHAKAAIDVAHIFAHREWTESEHVCNLIA